MEIVDAGTVPTAKRAPRRKPVKTATPVLVGPAPEPEPEPEPAVPAVTDLPPLPVVQTDLPPLPADGVDFTVDDKFRGITTAQDRVLDAVHRDGWTLVRLFTEPNAVLPLPPGRFPPGRVYLMTDSVAVVVQRTTGSVIASLPVPAALKTLHQFTPDVLDGDGWARARWDDIVTGGDAESDSTPRYRKQSWFDRSGSVWLVKRASGGARVYRDGDLVRQVADDVEAEEHGFHPVIVELVAYVLDIDDAPGDAE